MLKKLSIALVVFGFFFSSPLLADHHEEGDSAEMSDDAGDTMHDTDHSAMEGDHSDMDNHEDAAAKTKNSAKPKAKETAKKTDKKKKHNH